MPPLRLTSLLHAALPQLSQPSRALLSTLACVNGDLPPADEVATWIGLRSRYQLHRVLQGDGLPSLPQLAGWARVLYWICRAEETGDSLLELARRDHVDPSVAYRLVRRVTGKRWSQLRRDGVELVLSRLRRIRRAPSTSFRLPLAQSGGVARTGPRATDSGASHIPAHPAGVLAGRVPLPEWGLFDVTVTSERVALVPRPRAAAVELIDVPALKSIGSIRTGTNPTRVVATRLADRAYVTSQFAEEIGILNLRSGQQIGAIALAGWGQTLGAALAADERTLYITTNVDRLYAIPLGEGRRRPIFWVEIPQACQQLAVHPAGHRVYVPGWRKGTLTEYDTTSLRVCRTFSLGGCVQHVKFTANGHRMFIANEGGWLDVFTFGPTVAQTRVNLSTPAFGVGLSADESIVLVTLLCAGRVAVLDAKTLRMQQLIETGGRPRMMANDPAGRGIVITNEDGWLDLLM